jgi:hypothetical protein
MRRLRPNGIVWQQSRSGTRKQQGLDSAWIAQHHFHEAEGGLPSPFAFLGFVAAQTSRIRLGTGIVTLPLENPVRVAEDAAVLDLLSNGRFELGVGTGGNPSAFAAFGLDSAERADIFARNLDIVRNALAGLPLAGGDTLYPPRPQLCGRIWQATFSGQAAGPEPGKAGRRPAAVKDAAAVDGKLRARRWPRFNIPLSTPISTHCRVDASPGSWRHAASSSPMIVRKRCGWPISDCGVNAIASSRAVTRRRGTHWLT